MRIPLSYSLRNLWTRRLATALTAGGMALVVFVFATVQMLTQGLKRTLVETGSPDNVVLIREGSQTEIQSAIERAHAALVGTLPQVATGPGGMPLVSKEVVVLISLPKRGTARPANIAVRGVSDAGLWLRPQVRLAQGRMFRPGSSEIVAGRSIAERFVGGGIGERLRFGGREWTVVGVLDAGRTGFSSEIWGDAEQFMQAFRRPVYSSVIFRLAESDAFDAARAAVEDDQRLNLQAKRESVFYAEQSEVMAKFLGILGMVLSVIFSVGAVIGAMITMYAAVAHRVAEIGTLRALGFRSGSVLGAFLAESLFLGLLGGIVGVACASFMQAVTVSTMNWQTFAEVAFSFTLTPAIATESLGFALAMGLVGGVLPAARAARMNIVDALRAA